MLTLTTPGADVLPWDGEVCAHLGTHTHNDTLGCRIEKRYVDSWNESAPERARQLNRVAKQRADRVLRRRGINERRGKLVHAWEHQRRGALHQHFLVGMGSEAQGSVGNERRCLVGPALRGGAARACAEVWLRVRGHSPALFGAEAGSGSCDHRDGAVSGRSPARCLRLTEADAADILHHAEPTPGSPAVHVPVRGCGATNLAGGRTARGVCRARPPAASFRSGTLIEEEELRVAFCLLHRHPNRHPRALTRTAPAHPCVSRARWRGPPDARSRTAPLVRQPHRPVIDDVSRNGAP